MLFPQLKFKFKAFKQRLETNLKMVTVIEVISNCNKNLYPNVYKLLTILLTLPVTSCEVERLFSTLKRIKTYLRNSIAGNRLNGLEALNIHREINVDKRVNSEKKTIRFCNLKLLLLLFVINIVI